MTTLDAIRDSFRAVCLSHLAGLHWAEVHNRSLDEMATCETTFPAVWWGLPPGTFVSPGGGLALQDVHGIRCLFIDQTATDRAPEEVSTAHGRMDAIARQCWRRWANLYVDSETEYEGVILDILQTPIPRMLPVVDSGPKMLTGVEFTVDITCTSLASCMDDYFAAS